MLIRNPGDGRGLSARRLRPVERGRVRWQYLLDCRFALIASWVVAVAFTPYLGVKLLPEIKPTEGGHEAIYATSGYRRLRRVIAWSVRRKFFVAVPWCSSSCSPALACRS